jgi:hypothetical protein
MFPRHALTFACRFIVVHPCFIVCDNMSQDSLSFMTSLQKFQANFHVCPFVFIGKLLWHFGTHLAQIVWYQRSLWMIECADPQLMSNLLATSVTVLCLSSWTRALTCSIFTAFHEVVRWPKQSSSMVLVLPLWNLFTHWYTFLCVIQFFPYYANILLWISEGFTPYDHINEMIAHCSTTV